VSHVHCLPPDANGIARLVFDHPGKRNALNVAMWRALRAHVAALQAGPARVVVLAGAGGTFVAGGDIEEFTAFRFHTQTLAAFHEDEVAPALDALWQCELPLIAQIEGDCIGGGLEIAALCDLRIAGASARLGVPIGRLGFAMAPREVDRVARAIGIKMLRELLLEGRLWSAHEAASRGIVSRVVADADVAAEVLTAAHRMAALAPQAARLNKRTLRAQVEDQLGTRAQREPFYAYADSAEHREGIAAFLAKRPPRFDPP